MQLNGLEAGQVPACNSKSGKKTQIAIVPYSIGIDDLHHDDCVQQVVELSSC